MQQNVLWLDVAVNDAMPVRVVERARDLGGEPHAFGHRQLVLAIQAITQRFAVDVRHHVKEKPVHRS